MKESRTGLLCGIAAYVIWGTFPLYWPLLEPAGAVEILAHRVFWSALSMLAVVLLLRRVRRIRALVRDRRKLGLLALAAVVITLNWGGYIWGVNNGRVVETSLGYFINPLVTVLMGVLILHERLRRLQWIALGIASLAVVVLTVDYGRPPWIALLLAMSFATYGLAKKKANAAAVESLTVETVLLAPIAVAFLTWLAWQGGAEFGGHGASHAWLFVSTGVVTAIPLVLFGAAATRVSMVSLGLMQYLAPILQFGLGVFWFGEEMPPGRWAGFVLVWVALVLFTLETVNHRRRQLVLAADASAA